ncbi:MAG: nucleotidyltransferase domain-containing protein [Candidatus Hodarchaeota archaeon]
MTKKPEAIHEFREIVYDEEHWKNLRKLRTRALDVLNQLTDAGIEAFAYGSIARGDVSKNSDIDIIVPHQTSSYKIELVLGTGRKRELVQATPSTVMKGHIHLDDNVTVTFPIFKMMPREIEFYRWGGQASPEQLHDEVRIPGVDKRLILIEPTERGHLEYGVIGYESRAAKKLGVSIAIAQERVRVLKRRDKVGRTGVYLTRVLTSEESFESVTKTLKDSDPALRRTMERREK